jgi:hypothetical protein
VLRGLERPGVLGGAGDGHLSGDVDHRGEGLDGAVGDGLEELLVTPAGFAGLFVEMLRRPTALDEQRLEVAQQRRMVRIVRAPLARAGDLVQPKARLARGALVQCEARLRAVVAGQRERDPFERRGRERAVAQLRPEAGVGPQDGGRARDDPEEVRGWPAVDKAALRIGSDPSGAVRSSWI